MTATKLPELLPCPWCGRAYDGEPVVSEGSTFRWRKVEGCCTDGPEVRHDTLTHDQVAAEVESTAAAITAWNTRATTSTKLPELPEPGAYSSGGYALPFYTADQLRAYGDEREAYGRATAPAGLSDGENPPLPSCWTGSPVTVTWAEDGETSTREVYTAEQMVAYRRLP